MPKKSSETSQSSSSKYQHFKLHGNHPTEKVFMLVVGVLLLAFALGYLFQPNITSFLGVPVGY